MITPSQTILRLLMIDDQQVIYNQLCDALQKQFRTVQARLLDDLATFEKLLNLHWDVIVYHAAYDFDYLKAIRLIHEKNRSTPLLLLASTDPSSQLGLKILNAGISDIIPADRPELILHRLQQALRFSRLESRANQLDLEVQQLQHQTQSLVQHSEQAYAILQEGVHVDANALYASFFGYDDAQQLIGLPVLDVIQPDDKDRFKAALRRIRRGDLGATELDVHSLNGQARQQRFGLQFSGTTFEDDPAWQMVIMIDQSEAGDTSKQHHGFAQLKDVYNQLNFSCIQHNHVGMLMLSLRDVPIEVFQHSWHMARDYFAEVISEIHQKVGQDVLRLSETVFLCIYCTTSREALNEFTQSVGQALPSHIQLNDGSYPLNLILRGYLIEKMPTLDELGIIMNQTFNGTGQDQAAAAAPHLEFATPTLAVSPVTPAIATTPTPDPAAAAYPQAIESNPAPATPDVLQFSFGEAKPDLPAPALTIANKESRHELIEQLDNREVQLYFQQIYDKEYIDQYMYVASATFTYDQQQISLTDYVALQDDLQLALKVDRWILVEACKRLHNHLEQCPSARIIVNLHGVSLLDQDMMPLLIKLVNLINSTYNRPLILQFREEDVLKNLEAAKQFFHNALTNNVGIMVRDFGRSVYCTHILQQLKFKAISLTADLTAKLRDEDETMELLTIIQGYLQLNPELQVNLPFVDDVTQSTNAWSIGEARYVQGDAYQSPQQDFHDSSDTTP